MINLVTGGVIFCDRVIELLPLSSKQNFATTFPPNAIEKIRNMRNGYIWYELSAKIYPNDDIFPVWLCFNPQDQLEFVQLYPSCFRTGTNHTWDDWTEEKMVQDKKFCDDWLSKYTGLDSDETTFSWGSISSFCDKRGGGCGVAIRYTV